MYDKVVDNYGPTLEFVSDRCKTKETFLKLFPKIISC